MNKNILTNWGKSQRQMPDNHQDLKFKIMAEFEKNPKKAEQPKFSFRLPVFAFSTAALVLVLASVYNYNFNQRKTEQITTYNLAANGIPTQAVPQKSSASSGVSTKAPDGFYEKSNNPSNNNPIQRALGEDKKDLYYVNKFLPASGGEIAVKDNREFLKLAYSGNINSLHISELSDSIVSTLKGLDGRVDYISSSENSAHISFVIPQNHLDSFKLQLKSLAGKRFVMESLNAENKLSAKQGIEQTQKNTQSELANLEQAQKQLIDRHNKAQISLNSQIYSTNKQLAVALQNLAPNPMNVDLQNQVTLLEAQLTKLKNSLAYENSNYQSQMDSYNYSIGSIKQTLEDIKADDQNLLDSVATVSGVITIYKINWLEYVNTYFPFYFSIPLIIIIIAVIYLLKPKKSILIP